MARVRLVPDDELPPQTAEQVRAIEAAGGDASVARGLANHPEFFESFFRFYQPAQDKGRVEPALKELVRLRIARLNDCFT